MTNIVGFEARASIERQAREWLIRLDADEPLKDDEIVALREWMARSAAHRNELTRISSFWSQANVLTELAIPLKSLDHARGSTRARVVQTALAASGLLASTILALWWVQRLTAPTTATYVTAVGQQKTILLSDGSSVQLNTDTRVQVTYTARWRQLRLWHGEALFSVARDPNRAFEVYANDSVVRALGTAFAIRLDGKEVDVTVTKGAVDVTELGDLESVAPEERTQPKHDTLHSSVGHRLEAGQSTTLGLAGTRIQVQQLPEPELRRRVAWHEGFLIFSGEPLSTVVAQMNRYSPVTLVVDDPAIASVAIGGRFRIGDLDAILEVLHTNFGIAAHRVDERNIRLESERHR
jgi:transmembrane sensor